MKNNTVKIQKMLALCLTGRVQPIIKDVAGRKMLLGFERRSKCSRKGGAKHLLPSPMDLDQLVKEHKAKKRANLHAELLEISDGAARPDKPQIKGVSNESGK